MNSISTLSKPAHFFIFPLSTTSLTEASVVTFPSGQAITEYSGRPLYDSYIEKSNQILSEIGKVIPNDSEESNMKILIDFSTKLIERSQDLDPKIVTMINEHFWDLM